MWISDVNKRLSNKINDNLHGVISVLCYPKNYSPFTNNRQLLSFKERMNSSPVLGHTIGVHPRSTNNYTIDREIMRRVALEIKSANRLLAIGECGFDELKSDSYSFLRCLTFSRFEKDQKEAFIDQLKFSRELNLPVVIHSRGERYNQLTLDCLKEVNLIVLKIRTFPRAVTKETNLSTDIVLLTLKKVRFVSKNKLYPYSCPKLFKRISKNLFWIDSRNMLSKL